MVMPPSSLWPLRGNDKFIGRHTNCQVKPNSLPALCPLSTSAAFSAVADVISRRQAEAATSWCRRPPMTRILDRLTIQPVSGPFKALNIPRKKRNCFLTAEQPLPSENLYLLPVFFYKCGTIFMVITVSGFTNKEREMRIGYLSDATAN